MRVNQLIIMNERVVIIIERKQAAENGARDFRRLSHRQSLLSTLQNPIEVRARRDAGQASLLALATAAASACAKPLCARADYYRRSKGYFSRSPKHT